MTAAKDLEPFPVFESDEEAEKFVDEADLSEYDFSQFKPAHFEFELKRERVNIRLPNALLNAAKDTASREGIPCQRFIRETLENAVTNARNAQGRP